jgi:hypothetical protein
MKVRDHIIWKNEAFWRTRLAQIKTNNEPTDPEDQSSSTTLFYQILHRVLKEMIDFKVPIDVVDSFIAEQLSQIKEDTTTKITAPS